MAKQSNSLKNNNSKNKDFDSKSKRFRNKKKRDNSKLQEASESRPYVGSDKLSSLNDVSWYSRNPELLASAARLPFPYVPGMKVTVPKVQSKVTASAFDETFNVPGVFCIDFVPTIGYSADVNSPVSIAAKELYGRVRSKFSGSLEVDAPDMMMFNLALDSVHSYIAYLKRLYRAVSTFSPQNRDYPERIVSAITKNAGTDAHNIYNLMADKVKFWGIINELIHMVNKFSLPKDMDLYERHRWMCEHVYLDGASPRAQSYVFDPAGFWKIDETQSTGTSLIFEQISYTADHVYSVDYYYQYGKSLIQALSDWEDAYTISGYYSRAFEGDAMYKADLLLQDELLQPVFQPEVLSQIENATCVSFEVPRITQDPNTNAVLFQPISDNPVGLSRDCVCMNLHKDVPTGEDITIASRLMTYVKDSKVMCGTEAVLGFRTVVGADENEYTSAIVVTDLPTATTIASFIGSIARLSWFRFHPIIYIYNATNATPTSSNTTWSILGDVENFTVVAKDSMSELHRVCIYSEFNCFR